MKQKCNKEPLPSQDVALLRTYCKSPRDIKLLQFLPPVFAHVFFLLERRCVAQKIIKIYATKSVAHMSAKNSLSIRSIFKINSTFSAHNTKTPIWTTSLEQNMAFRRLHQGTFSKTLAPTIKVPSVCLNILFVKASSSNFEFMSVEQICFFISHQLQICRHPQHLHPQLPL